MGGLQANSGGGRRARHLPSRRSEVLAGCFERLQSAIPEYRSKNRRPEAVSVSLNKTSGAKAASGLVHCRISGGASAVRRFSLPIIFASRGPS